MRIYQYLAVFFFFACCVMAVSYSRAMEYDERTQFEERQFDADKLDDYRSSRDFEYGRPSRLSEYDTGILFWLTRLLSKMVSFIPYRFMDVIMYAIIIFAVVIVVYYIGKMSITGTVTAGIGDASVEEREIIEENIHSIDFDRAIREALAANQPRVAVRLYFLKALKFLDEKKLINHSREKTNQEYLRELRDSPLREDFKQLSRSFEFVWYGHITPEQPVFEQMQQRFSNFYNQLGKLPS